MENVGVSANYMLKQRIKSTIYFIICVLIALICLIPIYLLLMNATRSDAELARAPLSLIPSGSLIHNIKAIPTQYSGWSVFHGYANSLIVAGGSTILTVFFSAMTAYGLTVYDFKVRDGAYTFILAVMMIPIQVTSTGFVQFMVGTLKLADSFIPLVVPAIAAPAIVFYMRQYMKSSFPLDIVEAARIDGCGEFRTFISIAIPMMKPAIAVQAIFAFVTSWNNYFIPSLILTDDKKKTLPVLIANLRSADFLKFDMGQVYMMIAFSIFPVIIVYLILSKHIVQGVALGSVKG